MNESYKMKYVLTSCGLSILTNYLPKKEPEIKIKMIYTNSNLSESEIDTAFLDLIKRPIEQLKKDILKYKFDELKKLSAELNALIRFYKKVFDKKDIHYLFHTDTYLCKQAAEIIQIYLEHQGLQVQLYKACGLKTDNIENFHFALTDVVKDLSEEINGYKESGYEIIFNLTGGFKSVNSFLQTMASLYADKSIYIFESSENLLTIPKMPIKIDESIFTDNINLFMALENGFDFDNSQLEKIPKTLVTSIDKDYCLSTWGEIVWQKFKTEYFQNSLIEPIIEGIEYSVDFKKDFDKLSPNEKKQINESIIKLERYKDRNENLGSLRYHRLSGNIANKFSHEFYGFSGNDSRRVYCNEKNNKIILEKIDSHLK